MGGSEEDGKTGFFPLIKAAISKSIIDIIILGHDHKWHQARVFRRYVLGHMK